MFPPDANKLVAAAHDRFLKKLATEKTEKVYDGLLDGLSKEEQDDIELMKIIIKFVQAIVADVVDENNRLLIEKLKEKGIEL